MRHRLLQLPLLCVLSLCLLISPASSYGYVWCLGADGHAVMETALAGDCGINTGRLPAADAATLALNAEPDDCGPCLDISSSHQWGTPRTRDHSSQFGPPAPLATVAVVSLPILFNPPLTNGLVPESVPRISGPILYHRTTVLLI